MYYVYTFILGAYLIACLLLLQKAFSKACAAYILSLFIFPDVARFFDVQFHSLLQLILIVFAFVKICIYKESRIEAFQQQYPITKFWLLLAFFGFFGIIDYSYQFNELKRLLFTLGLFYVFLSSVKKDSDVQVIGKAITYGIILAGAYGIITYILKTNPYYLSFATIFGIQDKDYLAALGDGYANIRGGLSSRATGTSLSSLIWGQKCLVFLPFLFHLKKTFNIKVYSLNTIAIVLCCTNIFLSGHRSCILPMILFLVFFIYKKYKLKKIIKNIPFIIIGVFILFILSRFSPTLSSLSSNIETAIFFWNDNLAQKNNIGGSNLDMRINQLLCTFDMVRDHFLFGLGYSYPSFYTSHFGRHSIMLGFESIFFTSLISSGILGFIVWIHFFIKNIKKSRHLHGRASAIAIHGTYILSIFMTGIQSSFSYYIITTAILIKEDLIHISKDRN